MKDTSPATHCLATDSRGAAKSAVASSINKFLTFKLGNEEYGMDILQVQEIRSYEEPTRMANTTQFLKGIINLRGIVVPILDMRLKFNPSEVTYNSLTVVIVINVADRIMGMVVDGVSDVISLQPDQLRLAPNFSTPIGEDHVLAIGALDDRMLILLDIEKLMTSPDMGLVEHNLQ